MTKTYVKTYGIRKGYDKGKERFFVVCDGVELSLNYANAGFALKKSREFTKRCYRNFIRYDGTKIFFDFVEKKD